MRLLLDTNALIWFLRGDAALGEAAREAIEARDTTAYVSPVSAYEIALKRALGKPMPALPDDLLAALGAAGFTPLAVTLRHASQAGGLPLHHRDPWDRLLVAQAQLEDLAVATADDAFAAYGCRVVWR